MKVKAEKKSILRVFESLRKGGIVQTLFLLVLVLFGYFVLQAALVAVLRTSTPLHTPISRSMEPTLKIGDLLVIQGAIKGEDVYTKLADGDIVIFRNPRDPDGIPIVHRAIDKYEIKGKCYIVTKGDNNCDLNLVTCADNWYTYFPVGGIYNKAGHPEEYLIGKVILVIPYFGFIFRLLDEPVFFVSGYAVTVRVVLIMLLVTVFVYLELANTGEHEKSQTGDYSNQNPRT